MLAQFAVNIRSGDLEPVADREAYPNTIPEAWAPTQSKSLCVAGDVEPLDGGHSRARPAHRDDVRRGGVHGFGAGVGCATAEGAEDEKESGQ